MEKIDKFKLESRAMDPLISCIHTKTKVNGSFSCQLKIQRIDYNKRIKSIKSKQTSKIMQHIIDFDASIT